MNSNRFFLLVGMLLLGTSFATAQNRPLLTEWTDTVPVGKLRTELGFEFLQNVRFNLSGLEGDLTNLGILGLRAGVGKRAEVSIAWTPQQFLNVDRRFDAPNSSLLDFSGNSTSDFGNILLGTKLRFADESGSRPAIGFAFGVELPNGATEKGISTDETNFSSRLLLQKKIGKLQLLSNLGLGILGDPLSAGSQDDLFLYGLACVYALQDDLNIIADWNGRAGAGGIGTEERSSLRLGAQVNAAGLYWDAAFILGFKDTDPETGLTVGLSKDFSISWFK